MKFYITILGLLMSCTNAFASSEPVDVIKVTITIDKTFFDKCISNLQPYQGSNLSCVAFQVPKDRSIFKDGNFIATLDYITMWSESHCTLEKSGRLYRRQSPEGDILIVAEEKECLVSMKEAALKHKWITGEKHIFLIKN